MAIFKRRTKPIAAESVDQLADLARTGRPVLVDFFQVNCQPCRTMDGIVNELAEEFEGTAHVVKVDAARVPDAFRRYKVKSTPTFVVLTAAESGAVTMRWRASGLVKKDQLVATLRSAGAIPE
jgi:thioredoxin 1